MELINGETLSDRSRRGPLQPGLVVQIGTALADALRYVHARGITHRDVKASGHWPGPQRPGQ